LAAVSRLAQQVRAHARRFLQQRVAARKHPARIGSARPLERLEIERDGPERVAGVVGPLGDRMGGHRRLPFAITPAKLGRCGELSPGAERSPTKTVPLLPADRSSRLSYEVRYSAGEICSNVVSIEDRGCPG